MSETLLRELAKVQTNGTGKAIASLPAAAELPPDRAAAVEYGNLQFQRVAHERDSLRNENNELRDRLAAAEIENRGLQSQLTEASSRIQSTLMSRDQAVADHLKYEALFVSIQAQMRAFAVPSEPLIKDADTS